MQRKAPACLATMPPPPPFGCHVHTHAYTHAHTHTCTHTHAYTHMRTHTHTCVHTHMRTHTHAYTHMRTHTRTHTHTHTRWSAFLGSHRATKAMRAATQKCPLKNKQFIPHVYTSGCACVHWQQCSPPFWLPKVHRHTHTHIHTRTYTKSSHTNVYKRLCLRALATVLPPPFGCQKHTDKHTGKHTYTHTSGCTCLPWHQYPPHIHKHTQPPNPPTQKCPSGCT